MKRRYFMRQSFEGKTRDIISMEEYLKKRQTIKKKKAGGKADADMNAAAALKLAELLYV